MNTLVFDLHGQFAHFRAYDTTRENMSYPFPPRTAVLGLVAGIMGYERNSYWGHHPLNQSFIAIQILSPILRTRIRVNYLQTKNPMTIKGLKIFLPRDPYEIKSKHQRGFYAPVNLNVLRNVGYRIFFANLDEEIMEELEERLKKHKYAYPPYLGHANMHVEVKYKGKYKAEPLQAGIHEVKTVFPVETLNLSKIKLDNYGFSILFNIPLEVGYAKNQLFLKKVTNVVLNSKTEEGIKADFKENKVYEVKMENERAKIVFLN